MNVAFHDLAGYIFGDNTATDGSSVKIPMTSPVTIEKLGEESFQISFVMPAEYTLATLPKPNNAKVQLKEVKPQLLAALAWKGAVPTEKHMEVKAEDLDKALEHAGYQVSGNLFLFEYDPPFVPSWLRNNEVLVAVSKSDL